MPSRNFGLCFFGTIALSAFLIAPASAGDIASHIVIDFDTEDDFSTALIHGQIVDPDFDAVDLEFGNLFNLSSTQDGTGGHLGVTVFDSDQATDPNDPDLLVGRGNILILQNDFSPMTINDSPEGLRYTSPNDEADFSDSGSIVFDFLFPVEPLSIDIVDANGGFSAMLTLTDAGGKTRVYMIPSMWTDDVSASGSDNGWAELDLTDTSDQVGENTSVATAVTDPGYDPTQVEQLKYSFTGNPSSGGIDTLTFNIPEPTSSMLVVLGVLTALPALRRRTRKNA